MLRQPGGRSAGRADVFGPRRSVRRWWAERRDRLPRSW